MAGRRKHRGVSVGTVLMLCVTAVVLLGFGAILPKLGSNTHVTIDTGKVLQALSLGDHMPELSLDNIPITVTKTETAAPVVTAPEALKVMSMACSFNHVALDIAQNLPPAPALYTALALPSTAIISRYAAASFTLAEDSLPMFVPEISLNAGILLCHHAGEVVAASLVAMPTGFFTPSPYRIALSSA
jgi:hypothetical protein